MISALVIGGTGFIGRHTVENLIDHGYQVTSISRSNPEFSFSNPDAITHISADRTDEARMRELASRIELDLVIDCAAFYPHDVEVAVEAFADADTYVYVSSGGVYSRQEIPKREDETPLHDCSEEQATDDTMASYGPRKAEGDRIARATDNGGITGMSVRPSVLYGPESVASQEIEPTESEPSWIEGLPINQTLHDYWIDRVDRYERIVVPGDGTAIWHRSYVEDVADALRVVAEQGTPGEAYNVGDRRVYTLEDIIESIADALDTTVELVYASRRELAEYDLEPADFILYHHPATGYPHIHETCKIRRLGWKSTCVKEAISRTVEERIDYLRDQPDAPPNREAEERLLAELAQ
ncbi:NAD-dependent epimerase/dehydratase family protein [Halalkalicoccus salilacus]|uniref:NAD-dependent epimerase/dehydratase family protein n=1 Tax=Halalkalicoccus salilacus TaxID=3117459 RepID=UPI00300EC692